MKEKASTGELAIRCFNQTVRHIRVIQEARLSPSYHVFTLKTKFVVLTLLLRRHAQLLFVNEVHGPRVRRSRFADVDEIRSVVLRLPCPLVVLDLFSMCVDCDHHAGSPYVTPLHVLPVELQLIPLRVLRPILCEVKIRRTE